MEGAPPQREDWKLRCVFGIWVAAIPFFMLYMSPPCQLGETCSSIEFYFRVIMEANMAAGQVALFFYGFATIVEFIIFCFQWAREWIRNRLRPKADRQVLEVDSGELSIHEV